MRPVRATTVWHHTTVLALGSESDETSRRSTPASRAHRHSAVSSRAVRSAGGAGTARWRKYGPAAQRRANGVAYSADNKASGLLRRLLEVLPRGLRRLWDGAPCPITLAQFPARQHLAGKIRFSGPTLYYNYPLFTAVMHLLGARLTAPTATPWPGYLCTDPAQTTPWASQNNRRLREIARYRKTGGCTRFSVIWGGG